MLTLTLTHFPHARKELFLDHSLRVVSRSGLNPTERLMIEALPTLPAALGPALCLGGRTGALAMALWLRGQASHVALHVRDAHVQQSLQRHLEENHAPESMVALACERALPRDAMSVFWQMTRGDAPAEVAYECVEQLSLGPKGRKLYLASDDLSDAFVKRIKRYFTAVSVKKSEGIWFLTGTLAEPAIEADLPKHEATFDVSLRGHDPITLTTVPGVFCHRRADEGGLALTEVVAEQVAFENGDKVMDMGCGCGMDGILLATAFADKKLRITYQDSSIAARDSTLINLERYPHASEFIFSSEGLGDERSYDLFLANPPYFGDWRIAEFFIASAARLLKRGGLLAFVSKRESKPMELIQAAKLKPLNTFMRRGYTIILAEK